MKYRLAKHEQKPLNRRESSTSASNDLLSGDSVFLKSREMPNHPCPECDANLDGCTGIASDRLGTIPTTGTLTVCVYCATLLEFAEVGYVRASRDRLGEIPKKIRESIEVTIGKPIAAR